MLAMHPLAAFVNSVKTISAQGNFSCLCEFLHGSTRLLQKNMEHADTVLLELCVQQHSLGWLFVLLAKFRAATKSSAAAASPPVPVEAPNAAAAAASSPSPASGAAAEPAPVTDVERQFREFIADCSVDQVRYQPDWFAELVHAFCARLLRRSAALHGLAVVRRAIAKIQASPGQLTSLHADLCQLALAAQCFGPALQVLSVDVTDISTENGRFESRSLLLYYYYGGMIYAAVKQFERAASCFEIYFMVPALAISSIMVEAYKKHLLVSLILSVESQRQQRSAYHEALRKSVARRIRPLCVPYVELATAFTSTSGSAASLAAVVERNRQQFVHDSNLGLVKQCVSAHRRVSIQRLTKTFLTLSLADMASRVCLPSAEEAERHVVAMIADGEIHARINERDQMVRFLENGGGSESGGSGDDARLLARLRRDMTDVMALQRRMQALDEEIQLDQRYVMKSGCKGQQSHEDQSQQHQQPQCSSSQK